MAIPPPHAPVTWEHDAVLYDSDPILCSTVAEFLADGLRVGDALIVLSTPEHRALLAEGLDRLGYSWHRAVGNRRLRWQDARHALEMFMMGREADPVRFRRHVGGLVESSRDIFPEARVRAYGEMVDLIWKDGHPDQALRIEEMWNGLARTFDFSLLCAHARGNLYREASGLGLLQVQETHRRVTHA